MGFWDKIQPSNWTDERMDSAEERTDGVVNDDTGAGTDEDPLSSMVPSFTPVDGNAWYKASGLVQQVCDAPAFDAVREWFDLSVKLDDDDEETDEERAVTRMIMDELERLNAKDRIRTLISYSRRHNDGGLLFAGIMDDVPGDDDTPFDREPDGIKSIDFLNVLDPEHFTMVRSTDIGTSAEFHSHSFRVHTSEVHPSRVRWLVRRYLPDDDTGMSVPQSIVDAIKAQSSGLRTAAKMADEFFFKVWKSDHSMGKDQDRDFLSGLKRKLSSWGVVKIKKDEEIERPTLQISGIKELLDFIWENLSSLTGIPQSRFKGNAQGAIAGADNDLRVYYESTVRAEYQEDQVRPILDWLIGYIIKATDGPVRKKIGDRVETMDWNIEFRPLWTPDPKTAAEIAKLEAEADALDIKSGVISPNESRQRRHDTLEPFADGELPEIPDESDLIPFHGRKAG